MRTNTEEKMSKFKVKLFFKGLFKPADTWLKIVMEGLNL